MVQVGRSKKMSKQQPEGPSVTPEIQPVVPLRGAGGGGIGVGEVMATLVPACEVTPNRISPGGVAKVTETPGGTPAGPVGMLLQKLTIASQPVALFTVMNPHGPVQVIGCADERAAPSAKSEIMNAMRSINRCVRRFINEFLQRKKWGLRWGMEFPALYHGVYDDERVEGTAWTRVRYAMIRRSLT